MLSNDGAHRIGLIMLQSRENLSPDDCINIADQVLLIPDAADVNRPELLVSLLIAANNINKQRAKRR